jgi:hypothetical protein
MGLVGRLVDRFAERRDDQWIEGVEQVRDPHNGTVNLAAADWTESGIG